MKIIIKKTILQYKAVPQTASLHIALFSVGTIRPYAKRLPGCNL